MTFHARLRFLCLGFILYSLCAFGESPVSDTPVIDSPVPLEGKTEQWNIHGQATYIVQQKNNFQSPYFGQNSLRNRTEGAGAKSYSISATAFLGTRLWEGAEVYYNPEMFGGTPFTGQLVGLGGFQNGELQKGSYVPPVYYTARAFIRQSIGLGGGKEHIASGANQLAGNVDKNRIVISYGKFSSLDFFDQNIYSHDPRTQFQNMAIFSMGAYGYSADTKGYTYGAVVEWYQGDWVLRAGRMALPTIPNTAQLDYSMSQNYIDQAELTRNYAIYQQPGAIRFLVYQQYAFMGSYQNALALGQQTSSIPELSLVRQAGQKTWGYGLNVEQALTDAIGTFMRWSWNPGTYETQTLDMSNSLSGGVSIMGRAWSRPHDTLGIGFALNGISASQINYLQLGGMTTFIGDGALSYKKEQVIETYYSAKVWRDFYLSLNYQRIANPAFNSARGPLNIIGLRAHIEI